MLRPTFALMNRSLRQDVRRRRFHILRLVVVVALFCLLVSTHAQSASLAAPGLYYFDTIVWLNFSLITLTGIGFFATAITEEKEELTLQLFVIAGIRPLAILVGKSFNRFIAALTILIVQIPFTMLSVTLGGVKPSQIGAAYVSLAAYLFLVANVGLLFSVICRRSGAAMFFTAVALGGLHTGSAPVKTAKDVLISRGFIATGGTFDRCATIVAQTLNDASIDTKITTILKPSFQGPAVDFQVLFSLVAGTVLFVVSWLSFAKWNDSSSFAAPERGWVPRRHRLGQLIAPPRPWQDPLAWKDFYFLSGGKAMLAARFLMIPLFTAGIYLVQHPQTPWGDWWNLNMTLLTGVATTVLAAELAVQASRIFSEEVRWKTLSNIGMLPQSVSKLAYAKLRGCLLGCIPATFWLTVGLAGASDHIFADFRDVTDWMLLVSYGTQFVLFLYITAYLSLAVRWGSLPLAVLVFVTFTSVSTTYYSVLLFGPLTTGSKTGLAALSFYNAATALVVASFLHAAIGRRLRAALGY